MKKHIFISTIFVMLLTIVLGFAYAAEPETNAIFNETAAIKEFETINIKLSTQNLNLADLKHAVATIENLNRQAQQCITDNQNKIAVLQDFLKQSSVDKAVYAQNEDYKYLQLRTAEYTKLASKCRLFILRTQDTLAAYRQTLQKLSKERTFQRSQPVWEILKNMSLITPQHFNFNGSYQNSGLVELKQGDVIVLVLLIIIGASLGFYAHNILNTLRADTKNANLRRILKAINNYTIVLVPILLMMTCYFSLVYMEIHPTPLILLLCYALLFYLLSLILAKFLVYSLQRVATFQALLHSDFKLLYNKLKLVLTVILFYYISSMIYRTLNIPPNLDLANFVNLIFFSLLVITITRFCWTFIAQLCYKTHTAIFIKTLVVGVFSIIFVIQLIGYHFLAIYLFIAVIFSIFLSFLTWLLLKAIDHGIQYLQDNQSLVSQQLRYFLGVKPHKKLTELSLMKWALAAIVICIYSILLLKIWKIAVVYSDHLLDKLINGFKFGGLEFIPSRVILALLIFSLSLLCGRFVATYVTRHHQFEGEKDTQVAIASIIKYAWVAVSIVLLFLIAGFNFTNFAIIAGALSVGVGLGLQNIVNNFVSGIILLLEKPIKPGDRIAVGKVEGFVRKIRVRSTQITTLDNEDVIVPNSDLITSQVTNFMFRNRNWRVTCQVGVSYASDVALVERVLLEVGNQHPEVIKEGPSKPTVMFKAFSPHSLDFVLWCVIPDVNKKSQVISELNFAIYRAFSLNNIVIAYPQLDVHLKRN